MIPRRIRTVAAAFLALSFLCGTPSFSGEPAAPDEAEIQTLPGFKVERLYTVPAEQGSWVSLALDNKGRFIVSDQQGLLFRVTIDATHPKPLVEPIVATVKDEQGKATGRPIGAAQGICWAFDSLYVVVNGDGGLGSGLYRLRSQDGSDKLDTAQLLAPIPGAGEHGPHAVAAGPDGRSLYIVAGCDCGPPPWKTSRVPRTWGGDQLLSPEAQSQDWHTRNDVVPGGWVCRTDADGKQWEVFCGGLRNSYRLAFNRAGELFTSDNDDEWQIGLPWYRPPRICHIVSGGDFGWRSLSYKWPPYYPDGLQAVADLPRGSPSGLLFGTGAKFPVKYQRALFSLEWAFGKIYAIHLSPAGAGYTGQVETFVSGRPLAIADALIGTDGAMYFIVGGRSIQSHLYRLSYSGNEPTTPATEEEPQATADARKLRRSLEAFHEKADVEAIDLALQQLGSGDAAIRFAARVALEHQDIKKWQERIIKEDRVQARLTGAIALARCGDKALKNRLLEALNAIEWPKLPPAQKLELLRAYTLTLTRMGRPDLDLSVALIERLSVLYPAHDDLIDRELGQLLIVLHAPGAIDKTLPLLTSAPSQEGQIHLGNALIQTKEVWTAAQRKAYFEWLAAAGRYTGGREVFDLLADLQKQALDACPAAQRPEFEAMLRKSRPQAPPPPAPRKVVKNWTVAELLPIVKANLAKGDFARGRQVYWDATCIKCHYFYNEGTGIGPDLTSVAARFDTRSILESIVEPSKVVSDQWASKIIKTNDGKTRTGRVLCETNNKLQFAPDPLALDQFEDIDKANVKSIKKSPVSIMPEGLLDTFTQDEIVDLVAYLMSEGKKK